MIAKIKETAAFLKGQTTLNPRVAIVLGSGLGGLVDSLIIEKEIPYSQIPNFPVSTVKGHKGALIFGTLNNVEVVVQSGRFHYYEGYDMKTLTFPVRVYKELGIEVLILSNAAGGMNPAFKVGDIMLFRDHINLFGNNPLMGPNYDELGPRFPDMSEAYSKRLRKIAQTTAKEHNIHLQEGVYVGVTGPCFETPSEYRMFHILGGDAVGMSTVPETILAVHAGLKVLAISVISNMAAGVTDAPLDENEVLVTANARRHLFAELMLRIISKIIP